jgi:hypothetical protein
MTDDDLRHLYIDEQLSLPQIAARSGLPLSTVRSRLLSAGVQLRPRGDAIRLRSAHLSEQRRGVKRPPFTQDHRDRIRDAKLRHGDQHARGVTRKANGYLEYTRGTNKGRLVHVVAMEKRLGRRLRPDETVHHIDGDRQNNDDDNLALVTRAGHGRWHRLADKLAGRERARDHRGRFLGHPDDETPNNDDDPTSNSDHKEDDT